MTYSRREVPFLHKHERRERTAMFSTSSLRQRGHLAPCPQERRKWEDEDVREGPVLLITVNRLLVSVTCLAEKRQLEGRRGSAVKGTYCTCRVPEFNPQHPVISL